MEGYWSRRRRSLKLDTKYRSALIAPDVTKTSVDWGRRHEPNWSASLACVGIMAICPILVIATSIALREYKGSLARTLQEMSATGLLQFLSRHAPSPFLDMRVVTVYVAWLLFQAALYQYLPAALSVGQRTPAGHLLHYRTNGLDTWMVTHALFISGVYFKAIDPSWIAKNWSGLIIIMNVYGFLLPAFAYIKAHLSPTHSGDRKFSGSIIYDFYMGIEFNPRIGDTWDFKLFHNGRPGIVAWTLINHSFAALQYELHGTVDNSMILVNLLRAVYVLDFFANEDWYLRTIDICHDHFGFYLGWGSVVWLPTMYTIQAQFLAYHPVELSAPYATAIALFGIAGYAIFRSANHQKDLVRRTNGACRFWGADAQVLRCSYTTADGKSHDSLLLCSGWWGVSRHANYLGDLILSFCMCACCADAGILPWFYAVYMTVLLLHRCRRSEESCRAKYGAAWERYCDRVPWLLVPGVY